MDLGPTAFGLVRRHGGNLGIRLAPHPTPTGIRGELLARVHLSGFGLYADLGLVYLALWKGRTAPVLGVPSPMRGSRAVGRPFLASLGGVFSVVGYSHGSVADFLSDPSLIGSFANIIWHFAQASWERICLFY